MAVESFVNETRYRGICYRACGFEALGPTAGFERAIRDFYHEHGEPKQLYVKELQPGACALLRQSRWPKALAAHEEKIAGPCPWRAPDLESLLDRFGALREERSGHGIRRRLVRVAVTPEEIGLCGCRQVIAVRRERQELDPRAKPGSDAIASFRAQQIK